MPAPYAHPYFWAPFSDGQLAIGLRSVCFLDAGYAGAKSAGAGACHAQIARPCCAIAGGRAGRSGQCRQLADFSTAWEVARILSNAPVWLTYSAGNDKVEKSRGLSVTITMR